jgi:hypothetical protein
MKSALFSINLKDVGKGALIAAGTTVLGTLYPMLQSGTLPTVAQLQTMGIAGVAAGVAYLTKNFFTNSDNQLLTAEKK